MLMLNLFIKPWTIFSLYKEYRNRGGQATRASPL